MTNTLTLRLNGKTLDFQLGQTIRYGIKRGVPPLIPAETDNPFIIRDFSKCLACGRCVKACNEVQVHRVIQMGVRGINRKVITEGDKPLSQSSCVFCGECLQVCPVGALVAKKALGRDGSGRPADPDHLSLLRGGLPIAAPRPKR